MPRSRRLWLAFVFLRFRHGFCRRLLTEYHPFIHSKVEEAREHQSDQITQQYVPRKEMLKEQQETHLYQEATRTRKVIAHKVTHKRAPRAFLHSIAPYHKVCHNKVSEHCTFERYQRGEQILPHKGGECKVR